LEKRSGDFSNHWKFLRIFFQSLENITANPTARAGLKKAHKAGSNSNQSASSPIAVTGPLGNLFICHEAKILAGIVYLLGLL